MAGVTPIYGIRYPNSTTKAKDLGSELGIMGDDIERALQAAAIPAVTNARFVVAATTAARNAYFGTPATAAAQRTLQDSGATCYRADRGWTEQYFAPAAVDYPQGVTTAGWYPVNGKLPVLSAFRTGNQAITSAALNPVVFNTETLKYAPDDQFVWNAAASSYTVNQPGVYDASASVSIAGITLRAIVQILATGNAQMESSSWYSDTASTVGASVSGLVKLAAGATVQVMARSERATNVSGANLSLSYVEPF
jgi:hypothetical protein